MIVGFIVSSQLSRGGNPHFVLATTGSASISESKKILVW